MDALKAGRLLSCSDASGADADGFNPRQQREMGIRDASPFWIRAFQGCERDSLPSQRNRARPVHDRDDFRPRLRRETHTTGGRMKKAIFSTIPKISRLAILSLVLAVSASAFAQKTQAAKGAEKQGRIVLAINEGASGNLTATDIVFRYEEFKPVVEKALSAPVTLVAVRNAKELRNAVATGAYTLVMSRPADVLAEAIRDHGYQAVVAAKEPAYALFIVNKDSPLKAIADIKGKSIVTPDRYAYVWRIANAMMRDNRISMEKEQVRSMGDQAAIGWSMEGRFFDVGVVSSTSGVGRTWEKNGGRVLARSPEVPNTPIIASRNISAAQIQKLRATLVALESTASGAAVLKKIGVNGFKESSSQTFLDLLKWLGDLEAGKE